MSVGEVETILQEMRSEAAAQDELEETHCLKYGS